MCAGSLAGDGGRGAGRGRRGRQGSSVGGVVAGPSVSVRVVLLPLALDSLCMCRCAHGRPRLCCWLMFPCGLGRVHQDRGCVWCWLPDHGLHRVLRQAHPHPNQQPVGGVPLMHPAPPFPSVRGSTVLLLPAIAVAWCGGTPSSGSFHSLQLPPPLICVPLWVQAPCQSQGHTLGCAHAPPTPTLCGHAWSSLFGLPAGVGWSGQCCGVGCLLVLYVCVRGGPCPP